MYCLVVEERKTEGEGSGRLVLFCIPVNEPLVTIDAGDGLDFIGEVTFALADAV